MSVSVWSIDSYIVPLSPSHVISRYHDPIIAKTVSPSPVFAGRCHHVPVIARFGTVPSDFQSASL